MAGYREKMLVEMALNSLQQNIQHKHDAETVTASTSSTITTPQYNINYNLDKSTDESFDELDLLDDFDDTVKDPDWTLKRKRDDSTSESEAENEINEGMNPDNADIENEEVVETSKEDESVEAKSKNQVERIKLLRMQGKKYHGYTKDEKGKSKYCKSRAERVMSPRCCTNRCDKGWGGRQCSKVDDDARNAIFSTFWNNMSWSEKKVYVLSLVTKKKVSRRTTESPGSRRMFSYSYALRVYEQRCVVCKSLLLATLSLKEDTMYNCLLKKILNMVFRHQRQVNLVLTMKTHRPENQLSSISTRCPECFLIIVEPEPQNFI
ncbi:hypothetical protein DPMN_056049 [Dreissena polymorpha]|uniref:Uncharacterized protein n=1 Tax=Dreissena polymorpha TaxID=45954 RepID=A0A9D4CTR2_DREPO|nr:hypothetical protein DPMN_056049 [Dreissena polymorpha]